VAGVVYKRVNDMTNMNIGKRKSGIPLVGDLPWGSHFCQFYKTKKDLLDILVPYFKAGLQNNELCVWVTFNPVDSENAKAALKKAMPNFERYEKKGQVDLISSDRWYSRGGKSGRAIISSLDKSVLRGFEGIRLACNAFNEKKGGKSYVSYGTDVISSYDAIALFAYPREKFDATGLMDVVKRHRFALLRNAGRWEVIESSEARIAKDTLKRSEEKLQSIFNNMSEGMAFHRVVLDAKGKPCDYIFLEVNKAFERLTGLKGRKITGRRVTEILPGIEKDPADWIGRYGKVALTGKHVRFENYSEVLRKWFSVSAFSPHRGYFAVTFIDISERKHMEDALQKSHDKLEMRVKERTAELLKANERLRAEIEERVRVEQSLRLEEARLDALLQLSQISEAPLDKITGFTLEHAIALTRSKIGFVGFLNEDESVYTLHAVSKEVVKECNVVGNPVHWPVVDAGIWADAIRGRKTLFVNDYRKPHPRKKGIPSGHVSIERFMVVPFFEGEKIVTIAGVGNKALEYDRSDERQVMLLLSGMWGYVQKSRSREELRKAYDELEKKVEDRTSELAASNVALQQEIIERKQAEEALRESERRLARSQEIARLGSWELDTIKNELTWSDEVYRIFGLQPQEFGATYEAFLEMVYPGDRAAVDAAYSGSVREGKDSYEIEHRVVRKDTGEIRWVHEKCENFRDSSGQIIRSIGMVHDITERKQAEEALRYQSEFTKNITDTAAISIFVMDADGRLMFVNPEALRVFGFSFDEMKGQVLHDLIHHCYPNGRSFPSSECPLARIHGFGETVRNYEDLFFRKDGTPIHVLCSNAPLRINNQQVGAVLLCQDITERKKSEEEIRELNKDLRDKVVQLEAANKELDAFSYSVSHDLRAPLRSIDGFSLALLEDYADKLDAEGRDYLERVRAATQRMGDLIDDLLKLSMVSRAAIKHEKVNLSNIARKIADELRSSLPERQAEFVLAGDLVASGDGRLLEIVLENLLENAWKFTGVREKAVIEFGNFQMRNAEFGIWNEINSAIRTPQSEMGKSEIVYFVRDNGIGFDMSYSDKLFKPFQRLHKIKEFPGTGIGLATVKRIIERHGGRVWIHGKLDEGTTVYFTLK